MFEHAAGNARAYASGICGIDAMQNATVRNGTYGTVRIQDSGINSSVPDTPTHVNRSYPTLDQNWEAEFLGCEQSGMSAREIAERFGVSTRTISRWRRTLGVSHAAPTQTRPVEVHERVAQLLDDGCSFAEAARTVGVSSRTVARWFPDRSPWSKQQASELAVAVRLLGRAA